MTKQFGAHCALDSVDLVVQPRTVHALVGENGAGKTTLMRVLFGAIRHDQGTVKVRGEERHFRNQAAAAAARIGMVSQHSGVVPELTNLQNLMLGAEGGLILDLRSASEKAKALEKRLGFSFDWHEKSERLSPASAQKLEILKLLWRGAEVMILDEPTSMLSPQDSDALFASLRQLVSEGATVIVVTHRLPEVLDHCSQVTVLRGGKQVADMPVAGVTPDELADLIVGRAVTRLERRPTDPGAPVVLSVAGLSVQDDRGHVAVREASLELRRGEVVGLAGVDGNGQRELVQALFGVRRASSGRVLLTGEEITHDSTATRLAKGFRLVAEDRHEEAVIADWSVEHNATLGLQRVTTSRGVLLEPSSVRQLAEKVVAKFGAKVQRVQQPLSGLSGGNQQRVVVGRALTPPVSVLLAFQPSRGLDVDATAKVYQAFREIEAGCALVVSFDLDELLAFCDRVLVMSNGRLTEPAAGFERDRAAIGRLMVEA